MKTTSRASASKSASSVKNWSAAAAMKEALESARQRLIGLSSRLKRYTKEQESKRVNRLFTHNPSRVYSMLKGEQKKPMPDPPTSSTARFWKDIWENQSTHNTQADWLKRLKDSHQNIGSARDHHHQGRHFQEGAANEELG